jgi:hypothetical protein
VASLARDPSAEATTLLRDLLRALPTATTWREPLVETYLALASRDAEDTAYVEDRLRTGTSAGADLALLLARQAKTRAVLDVLERWEGDPVAAPIRPRLRREVAFLHGLWAARGGLPADRTTAFAGRLAGWIDEPGDPSAAALAGTLTELAGAGDAVLAAGLRGARREVYLSALRVRPSRYLSPEVTAALLDPVDGSTPVAVRRTALEAVLAAAGADALPAIEALASRLPAGARDDVEVVRRIVRQRTSSRPP